MTIRSYRDLEVWQKGMDLAAECYRITEGFPGHERYGLASQPQRAAASVPANIAEGQARQHTKEFLQFLSVASGSLAEVETYLLLAVRLNYLPQEHADRLLEQTAQIGKMLTNLRKALRNRVSASH
jgi:four helix bundle protein